MSRVEKFQAAEESEANANFLGKSLSDRLPARKNMPFRLECHFDLSEVEDVWRGLETLGHATLFESYDWCYNWSLHGAEGAGERPIVIVGYNSQNKPIFLLPMALTTSSGVMVLTWLAQDYSCYNMPICLDEVLPLLTKGMLLSIFAHVRRHHTAFDAMLLTGQPEQWDGRPNIMKAFHWMPSGQDAYTVPLGDDFEAMHTANVSKSTRKKLRSKRRQLEKVGEVEFGRALSAQQRKHLYRVFLDYKATSLQTQGKKNVYEQNFLNQFFFSLIEAGHLEHFYFSVDDDVLAVSYGIYYKNQLFSITRAMKDTSLSRFSPGLMLLMGELAYSIEKKVDFLDLGPGNSVYKKHWGYEKIKRFDCCHPFSLRGRFYLKAYQVQFLLTAKLKDYQLTKSLGHHASQLLYHVKERLHIYH